jgi:uncharacterized SAM-binding protein YcdF (DUF218 family)
MFRRFVRFIGLLTMAAAIIAAVLFVVGYFRFVERIPETETKLNGTADGIVVLTGAAARIPDAIGLLAADRGQRLLITGVYRNTRSREIARLTPLYNRFFACCIDLDRDALNTYGNAIQARRWAHMHHFKSLIVVTSNWHLPRAMVEIRHQLPDIKLIAYPVMSERIKNDPWWSNADTARFLLAEYVKYLFALARFHVDAADLAE